MTDEEQTDPGTPARKYFAKISEVFEAVGAGSAGPAEEGAERPAGDARLGAIFDALKAHVKREVDRAVQERDREWVLGNEQWKREFREREAALLEQRDRLRMDLEDEAKKRAVAERQAKAAVESEERMRREGG